MTNATLSFRQQNEKLDPKPPRIKRERSAVGLRIQGSDNDTEDKTFTNKKMGL
jgi:hypothetical protein